MKDCAIIVTGNIASGKSSFCERLSDALPHYAYLNLDRARVNMSIDFEQLNGMLRERLAEQEVSRQVAAYDQIIYESSGVSRYAERTISRIAELGFEIIRIHLSCPIDVCKRRYLNRLATGHRVPMPYKARPIQQALEDFAAKQERLGYEFTYPSNLLDPDQIVERFFRDWLKLEQDRFNAL